MSMFTILLQRRHLNQPHHKSASWGPGLPDVTCLGLAGVEVVTVSEFLGLSSIEMTLGDAHPSSENKRQAVQCLGLDPLWTRIPNRPLNPILLDS